MKQLNNIIVLIFFFTFSVNAQNIDEQKSKVTFKIKNMKWKTVEGSFGGMKGNITFDPSNLSAADFDVCIDATTVDTESKKRDKHLQNEDFFDVPKYPTICIKSTEVMQKDKGYELKGSLTMHGETKDVSIPFSFENNTFTGKLTVNRFDHKVGEDTGTFMVGQDSEIEIVCVLK